MTDHIEVTSNPMAPPETFCSHEEMRNSKLSNSDFRKLLMTPRPAGTPAPAVAPVEESGRSNRESMNPPDVPSDGKKRDGAASSSTKQQHKQKRHHHHRHYKRDHARETAEEQSSRYRDRAKERREGKLVTPVEEGGDEREFENDEETLSRTADYRAVAPSTAAGQSMAERRRMIIQESKYLGGDMEHTHLVKGLDFVLLQKVRLEIQNKEMEAENLLDAELEKPELTKEQIQQQQSEDGKQFRTKIGAAVFDLLFNEHPVQRNEYFQPGRMAYRIELEDDSVDFEVPATVIRSKSDCTHAGARDAATITTNEIVINKLTQILSYLRAGKRHAKKAKLRGMYASGRGDGGRTVGAIPKAHPAGDSDIYDDIGKEYVPSNTSHRSRGHSDQANLNEKSSRVPEDHARSKSSYFERPPESGEVHTVSSTVNATKEFMRDLNQRFAPPDGGQEKASLERFFEKTKVTCYDECYPGFVESYDAMGDSDDEADFTKMDLGNKKGPVGRWDFETQEEYSEYMSSKEALPKAAFQYGVKMADGRRTRRLGPKDEKAELDRQYQKIQSIIQKRKMHAEETVGLAKNPRY